MGKNTTFNFPVQGFHHGFSGYHDDVRAGLEPVHIQSKHFPDLPLCPVAFDGIPYLFGSNDAEPF